MTMHSKIKQNTMKYKNRTEQSALIMCSIQHLADLNKYTKKEMLLRAYCSSFYNRNMVYRLCTRVDFFGK